MSRYTSRVSNGKGFRLVYMMDDRWRWQANVCVHRSPPRSWSNRAGWSRTKAVGVAKSFGAYFWLWVRRLASSLDADHG